MMARPSPAPNALAAGLLLVYGCAAVPPVMAQDPSLRIMPRAGVYTPAGAFTTTTEIETALALGAAAELLVRGGFAGLRVTVDHVLDTDLAVRGGDPETRMGRIEFTTVVMGLVFRPLPRTLFLRPHFVGGVGVKRYAIDLGPVSERPAGEEFTGISLTPSRFTTQVGGGFDILFGPLNLQFEFSDYIGTFVDGLGQKRFQNDMIGTVGVSVRLF